ncbi:N-acetylglucosamine-6-phosphate deacetylase [Schaalia canis]|uniref:N-acetylglucosamine-6-phosphate deacetylase n=1 Tax=Schaalia canis TaxID=100469 RepID=A0A3P1SCV3_9ACTO|nr:amidohydrolase family protein [Schaalia canis]RRC94876.1 N-acetylglucosamine-6-phosphate deacetylase [Schaalia canis]
MSDNVLVLRGRVILPDTLCEDGLILCAGDTITAVGERDAVVAQHPEYADLLSSTPHSGLTYMPGLVDVHCHGGGGESFPNASTREQAMVAINEHRAHGTTTLVASTVTAAPDVLVERATLLGALTDEGELAGIHFEGPFVSHERKGAQDGTYIIDPDPKLTARLIEATNGNTVTMTLAPEKPGMIGEGSVVDVLIEGGALPSWGHTDADPAAAKAALEYSREVLDRTPCRRSDRATVTHLFNGMRPLHHRDPGPIAEFLADSSQGGAVVEMICDGIHLDPAIVREVYTILGREQCVFVTDAMAAAGMADGEYQLGPQKVRVEAGVARLAEGDSIAGGTAHLMDCVRVAVQQAQIPLIDAVYMATETGAAILGDTSVGRLEAGRKADVVAVDGELSVVSVWRRGTQVR